jgi:hypothetical protein
MIAVQNAHRFGWGLLSLPADRYLRKFVLANNCLSSVDPVDIVTRRARAFKECE